MLTAAVRERNQARVFADRCEKAKILKANADKWQRENTRLTQLLVEAGQRHREYVAQADLFYMQLDELNDDEEEQFDDSVGGYDSGAEEYLPGAAADRAKALLQLNNAAAAWTAGGCKGWGTPGKHYPPEVVLLYLDLCCNGAPAKKASLYVGAVLRAFRPDLWACMEDNVMKLPSVTSVKRWRDALQVLADITAGVKLSTAEHITLHCDGTTLAQLKLAVCAFQIRGGNFDRDVVLAGGVHIPKDGSAEAAMDCLFTKAFTGVDDFVTQARKFIRHTLNKPSDWDPACLPPSGELSLLDKVNP